jgi:hypothetical protein
MGYSGAPDLTGSISAIGSMHIGTAIIHRHLDDAPDILSDNTFVIVTTWRKGNSLAR